MKVFPIDDPVQGEQVLAVQPGIKRYPKADWRQRLQYFSGRALTHTALRLEQLGRTGHLASLGQAVSPGVVQGLEPQAVPSSEGVLIEIAAGMGIAASGEIIHINRNQQVSLDAIRVYAPAAVLEGEGQEGAYRLGDTLGALRTAGAALPQAMILILQPVAVEHFSQEPSSDPCDYDPSDEAFENWQWVDGCRLLLYAWDSELGPLPAQGDWRRNRLAYAIFDYERGLPEGAYPSWTILGVPIALIGLNETLNFQFMDRGSVVRLGGGARGGQAPVTPAGDRFLWQAQFEQFNEHLLDWIMTTSGLEPADLQAEAEFRHLPPVGVLPRQAVDPRQQVQHFFPPGYSVQALAIPHEQLDLAIKESAALLPYDLNTPDMVEVLVPVPQQHFDPGLLEVAVIDPEFEQAVARLTVLRDEWLGRRLIVRKKASVLFQAIKGRPILFATDDPNAVDSLEQPTEYEQQLVKRGDSCRYFKGRQAPPANWIQAGFDDSGWEKGVTGLGYGLDGLGTSLEDMPGGYLTIFFRHRFSLASLPEAHRYSLGVTSQGGFYAYLNGRLLSSDNVKRPLPNAPAAESRPLEQHIYELGELKGRLRKGENVLAIQAHNTDLNAEVFSISVELLDSEDSFGTTERSQPDQAGAAVSFGQEEYEVDALGELGDFLQTGTPLSESEVARLDELGIEEFVDFLQQKIKRANDRVEFGFLRLRTDMYRVRQMMLGNEVGTKLATSPALAEIAKGESAAATKDELSDFYNRLKKAKPRNSGDAAGGASLSDGPSGSGSGTSISGERRLTRGKTFVSGELSGRDLSDAGPLENVVLRDIARGSKTFDLTGGQRAGVKPATRLETETSSAALFKYATPREVGEQNPVVGLVQDFNNVTVGERLQESSANVSYMAGVAVKGELLSELLETDISIDDLGVPGLRGEEKGLTFADIRADVSILDGVLAGEYDPIESDDEAGYFNAGIKALENGVGVLRLIEGRVQAYRRAVSRCQDALGDVQRELDKADERLKTIGDELAEARHDVSVARALKAEEQARIDALNEKRDKLLENQVTFLLFRRPRSLDPRLDAPLHFLNPDLSDQPLPLCDVSVVETPESVAAMLDVLRDAPMKWFGAVQVILPHLSRLSDLQVTIVNAKKRAESRITVHPFLNMDYQMPDQLLQGIGGALRQSQQRVQVERKKTRVLDLNAFQGMGWQESIKRVSEVVSLGDLIDGNHGRMGASQRSARELDLIADVVTCLYVGFSEVPAAIRLDWARRLSQFDQPVDLGNLFTLPRFGELNYLERHNLQRLVDWLFGRIVSQHSEARHMISDLIRVALLAAGHAPVNQLIAGYIPEPIVVHPGSFVNVVVDQTRVRVGMAVSMVSRGAALARGRVADISGGRVTAEVQTVVGDSVQLEMGARVQIGGRLGYRQLA